MTITDTLLERAHRAAREIITDCAGKVPADTLNALSCYLTKGMEPSGFLLAVLSNDLCNAACKADTGNVAGLGYLARAIEQRAPLLAHGSPEKVDKWIDGFSRRDEE